MRVTIRGLLWPFSFHATTAFDRRIPSTRHCWPRSRVRRPGGLISYAHAIDSRSDPDACFRIDGQRDILTSAGVISALQDKGQA